VAFFCAQTMIPDRVFSLSRVLTTSNRKPPLLRGQPYQISLAPVRCSAVSAFANTTMRLPLTAVTAEYFS
jgi:hypothetical protein